MILTRLNSSRYPTVSELLKDKSSEWVSRSAIEPGLELCFHSLNPGSILRNSSNLGLDLLAGLFWNAASSRVALSQGNANCGKHLEISDGWLICAGDESVSVALQATTNDRDVLVPEVLKEDLLITRRLAEVYWE